MFGDIKRKPDTLSIRRLTLAVIYSLGFSSRTFSRLCQKGQLLMNWHQHLRGYLTKSGTARKLSSLRLPFKSGPLYLEGNRLRKVTDADSEEDLQEPGTGAERKKELKERLDEERKRKKERHVCVIVSDVRVVSYLGDGVCAVPEHIARPAAVLLYTSLGYQYDNFRNVTGVGY